MRSPSPRRFLLAANLFSAVFVAAVPAAAQDGVALRETLGTLDGTGPGGVPRYLETSGWNNGSSPTNNRWAVDYGTPLNNGGPWVSVLKSDRTNAGLAASANQLTLDLGGYTYLIRAVSSGAGAASGRVSVTDAGNAGSYLRIANGTLNNDANAGTNIGDGAAGRAFVENATLQTRSLFVGRGVDSNGFLTLDAGGKVTASTGLRVGHDGVGRLELRGTNSSAVATEIYVGNTVGTGTVVLNDGTALLHAARVAGAGGNLTIANPSGAGVGMVVNAGTVRVDGNLTLATAAEEFGAISINGGSVEVGGNVSLHAASAAAPNASGGKIYLDGGRFEVKTPTAFAPAATGRFYWKNGTLAFSDPSVTLTGAQVTNYTRQGADYGGGRAAGKIGPGQTLEAEGRLTLSAGTVGLAGGTIKAANGLVVSSTLSGHGTVDAAVSGNGAVVSGASGDGPLSLGSLNGATVVSGTGGEVRVGHLGLDGVHTGGVAIDGRFTKVGTGTQTLRGGLRANGGVTVEAGRLVLDGGTLTNSPVRVSAGGTARLQNGATGSAAAVRIDAGPTPATSGRLQIDGAATSLTAAAVTNDGWIELTNGGTLTVGSAAAPGQLVNTGHLLNGGTLNAAVTGTGRVSGGGTFNGGVTVGGGAVLAPGNSPGAVTVDDLAFASGGLFEFEIADAEGTAGVDWDLASVTRSLAVTAAALDPFTIVLKSLTSSFAPGSLAGFDPTRPFSWRFVTLAANATFTGFDPSKFAFDTSGFDDLDGGTFGVTADATGLSLTFTPQLAPAAVPEPGTLTLLGLAGLGAGAWAGRKRRPDGPAADAGRGVTADT